MKFKEKKEQIKIKNFQNYKNEKRKNSVLEEDKKEKS